MFKCSIVTFVCFFLAGAANAEMVDIPLTFDLTTGVFTPNPSLDAPGQFSVTKNLDTPFELLRNNNSINISVNFLPGQKLRLFDFTGPNSSTGGFREFVQIGFGPTCSCSTGGNGLMEFSGVSGDYVGNPVSAFTNTSNGFTVSTDWSSVDLTSTSFDLSGFQIENYNYSLNFLSSYLLTEASIRFNSDRVEVLETSPVPIPAALPLFLAALAGLGFIGRRRKQTVNNSR